LHMNIKQDEANTKYSTFLSLYCEEATVCSRAAYIHVLRKRAVVVGSITESQLWLSRSFMGKLTRSRQSIA